MPHTPPHTLQPLGCIEHKAGVQQPPPQRRCHQRFPPLPSDSLADEKMTVPLSCMHSRGCGAEDATAFSHLPCLPGFHQFSLLLPTCLPLLSGSPQGNRMKPQFRTLSRLSAHRRAGAQLGVFVTPVFFAVLPHALRSPPWLHCWGDHPQHLPWGPLMKGGTRPHSYRHRQRHIPGAELAACTRFHFCPERSRHRHSHSGTSTLVGSKNPRGDPKREEVWGQAVGAMVAARVPPASLGRCLAWGEAPLAALAPPFSGDLVLCQCVCWWGPRGSLGQPCVAPHGMVAPSWRCRAARACTDTSRGPSKLSHALPSRRHSQGERPGRGQWGL